MAIWGVHAYVKIMTKKSFLKHLACQIKSIGRLDSATLGLNIGPD